MSLKKTLAELKTLGDERIHKHNAKRGAGDNQFGVKSGDIRKIAKRLKKDHALALELWASDVIDARMLAILMMKPNELSSREMNKLVRSCKFVGVADWLNNYVVKQHPDKEALRTKWMGAKDVMAARAGWSLTSERVVKSPEGLDLKALLDRIESEMGAAPDLLKWNMNWCLGEIGIHCPKLRKRALAIGEKIGAYRDLPTSKGCTSPFVPIWVNEMVSRQG
jgi:3-methyladenine DNA glycosylase AlkD